MDIDKMDIYNTKEIDRLVNDIDKIIIIRWVKEKKTNRTYVSGLHDFLEVEIINKLVKKIKERLGTGSLKSDTSGGIIYGFQGEHKEKIKKFLLENTEIPESRIKIQ